jgi:hypothetical protein
MTTTTAPRFAGPPISVLGVVTVATFVVGLVVTTAIAGEVYPQPTTDAETVRSYFADNQTAMRVNALFTFGSAVTLAIYTAAAVGRLNQLGVRVPGVLVAQVGGTLSAGFLALTACAMFIVSQPGVTDELAVVRALHNFAYATGGPAHVATLGLLLAGVSVPGLLLRLLPRWTAWLGLVVAGVAELSTLSLAVDQAAYLLPIARFPALVWIVAVGFLLPRARRVNAKD